MEKPPDSPADRPKIRWATAVRAKTWAEWRDQLIEEYEDASAALRKRAEND